MEMIRNNRITFGLSTMNALSTSQILSFLICSIRLRRKFENCCVVLEIAKYISLKETASFHRHWPKGEESRASESNHPWVPAANHHCTPAILPVITLRVVDFSLYLSPFSFHFRVISCEEGW